MKAHKYFVALVSTWVLFLVAMAAAAQKTNDKAVPVLADADKTKIREFQLRDVRFADAIKQRQLEIVSLQTQQQQNLREFQGFIAGVCKNDRYEFDVTSEELKCVGKKSPADGKKP